MKLLFDENLSQRLIDLVADEFPGSTHIEVVSQRGASDAEIWDLAKSHGYVIVSKDNDFRQRAVLYGAPPKIVWLAIGNAGTKQIAALIRRQADRMRQFGNDPASALLVVQDLWKQH